MIVLSDACGLDEAGRGPLAGPVVAACVLIPPEATTQPFWTRVRDSKKLSAGKREQLYAEILEHCACGIAEASVQEIDTLNILRASLLAMRRAFFVMLDSTGITPSQALVDGKQVPDLPCASTPVVGGDDLYASIAAASILAKVTRDRVMTRLHQDYPAFGWARNAGYPTQAHRQALLVHGVTPHHRTSFAPVRKALQNEGEPIRPLNSGPSYESIKTSTAEAKMHRRQS